MDTLVPIGNTGLSRYTGHSVITTASGQLFGSDSGIIKTVGQGAGSFVTVVRIVGGTGEFAGRHRRDRRSRPPRLRYREHGRDVLGGCLWA